MKQAWKILFCLGCMMLGLVPNQAEAQEGGTRTPVPHDQVISANPFILLAEWFNAEYERKISPTSTLGVGASRFSFDDGDESYTGLNGFYRYYPQGAALSGFYIGGRLAYHNVHDDYDDDDGDAFGVGFDIGYTWLLGVDRKFYIGLGIGATRLFGGDINEDRVVIPSIRLINIGFAF